MNIIILDKTIIDAIERIAKKKKLSDMDALELILKDGITSIFIKEGLHEMKFVNEEGRWESNSSLNNKK